MAKIASKAFLLNISTILPNGADDSTAFPEELRDLLEQTLLSVIGDIDSKYVVEVETIEE
jgi:hypothetical protein